MSSLHVSFRKFEGGREVRLVGGGASESLLIPRSYSCLIIPNPGLWITNAYRTQSHRRSLGDWNLISHGSVKLVICINTAKDVTFPPGTRIPFWGIQYRIIKQDNRINSREMNNSVKFCRPKWRPPGGGDGKCTQGWPMIKLQISVTVEVDSVLDESYTSLKYVWRKSTIRSNFLNSFRIWWSNWANLAVTT